MPPVTVDAVLREMTGKGKNTVLMDRGVARNLLRGTKQGVWWTEAPSGVQGQSPGVGLGAKPPEAGDILNAYRSFNGDGGCTNVPLGYATANGAAYKKVMFYIAIR